nr:uncharacterized protein LOC116770747 [Danaus plexippus plexippus]
MGDRQNAGRGDVRGGNSGNWFEDGFGADDSMSSCPESVLGAKRLFSELSGSDTETEGGVLRVKDPVGRRGRGPTLAKARKFLRERKEEESEAAYNSCLERSLGKGKSGAKAKKSFPASSKKKSVPVLDCIEIVRGKLKDKTMPIEYVELLKRFLTSGYLMWKDEFYIQVDEVAMGSPVLPFVADIFMEDFEVRGLCSPPIRPLIYKRYADGTYTILNKNEPSAFLNHLNIEELSKIQFTIQLEAKKSLAFLDILFIRNPENTLGHTVYRKPTHRDRYQKESAQHFCDADHLEAKLQHLKHALTINNLPVPRQHRKNYLKSPTVERQPAIL